MSIWLAAAMCLGFAALALLVMRLRTEVRRSISLVSQALELLPAHPLAPPPDAGEDSGGWPQEAAIQAGAPAPPQLLAGPADAWLVAVLGRNTEQVAAVLPQGSDLDRLRSRYELVAAVAGGAAAGPLTGVVGEAIALPEAVLGALPPTSAAMIDPDGVVQGVGEVSTSADLLAFVYEGEHHGFGPPAEPAGQQAADAA